MALADTWRSRAVGALERLRSFADLLSVGLVAAVAAALATENLDFPLALHPDEDVKIWSASGNTHNYYHPPLLIVAARFVAWLAGASSEHGIALSGRTVSAVAAIGASMLFFGVLRRNADGVNALLWSLVFAASPAVAVHAHYFKEDAVLVFSICLGLFALTRVVERADTWNLTCFGLALGLAVSAKYVGALNSLLLFAFATVHCRLGLRQALLVVGMYVLTILLVFLASFAGESRSGLSTVLAGLAKEINHVEVGHDLKEWFLAGYGLTHIRYHLIPSLTAPTFVIAAGSIAAVLFLDRDRRVAALVGAALIWLLVLEITPLKIVGSMRYVLPVVVYVLLAAGIACSALSVLRSRVLGVGLGIAAGLATSYAGIAYVANMGTEHDTRAAAMRWVEKHGLSNVVVDFWMGQPATATRFYDDIGAVDYLVSQRFERFLRGATLREQDQQVYVFAGMFRCLDGHIVAEFSEFWGDFAYVAPTVRIYDLRRARECLPQP